MERQEKILFGPYQKGDFYSTVKLRAEKYFKEHGISRYGNTALWLKTALITLIYLLSYCMILSNYFTSWGLIGWYSLLGLMTGLMGFNFSHDVMHGAYFSNVKWNKILSYVFDFNGTSSYIWKVTHNQNHHIYTNIPGHDDDIDKAILLRLNPSDKLYPFHRFQWLYAPFLYFFTTVNWVLFSDYLWTYRKIKEGSMPKEEIQLFFLFKFLNLIAFLLIPLLLLSNPWWQIVLGFFSMHFAAGFVIAIIFQLAHVVEEVQFPLPEAGNKIEIPWAEHEMKTTANFATESKFWAFWLGGLNYQIEHHLFSYVSHIHYPKLAPIVKQTAAEYNLPYYENKSLTSAILSHLRLLKKFGKE